MAAITIEGDHLYLRLSRWERIIGLLKEVDVPLTQVTSAEALPDPITEVHGLKAGTGLPNYKLGTWVSPGRRTIAAVRRGKPGLRVTVQGRPFDELVVSQPDAGTVVTSIG